MESALILNGHGSGLLSLDWTRLEFKLYYTKLSVAENDLKAVLKAVIDQNFWDLPQIL